MDSVPVEILEIIVSKLLNKKDLVSFSQVCRMVYHVIQQSKSQNCKDFLFVQKISKICSRVRDQPNVVWYSVDHLTHYVIGYNGSEFLFLLNDNEPPAYCYRLTGTSFLFWPESIRAHYIKKSIPL